MSTGSLNFPFISPLKAALPAKVRLASGEMFAKSILVVGAMDRRMSLSKPSETVASM